MPDITLRAYSKEIDDLIEHDQLDEAIAHCRHILQTYPKHLDTYRSLGKSYLEAKRYGDAADIFQRVLSAIPDDFVSHIGMSIVREDEGNIDAAIWHMERAFETNPANPAIQQELRRLIGRRDGLEPHKVRLTRGALARMYAQGELYPQAIAELQSALAEDADRPDLEVILAKMYWYTEQLAEAAETASHVLEDLPFCFEANRITAGALQSTGNSDDARAYLRRLVSLDPYMAFIENAMSDTLAVDPATVRLAKLDWVPGQPMPAAELKPAEWSSAEDEISEPGAPSLEEEGEVPGWMAELEKQHDETPTPEPAAPLEQPAEISPDSQPFSSEIPQDNGDIPDWMREAGWTESDGEAPEAPVSFSDQELEALEAGDLPAPESDTGDLAPAEIPSWLQDIAPEETAGDAQPVQPETSEPAIPTPVDDKPADAPQPPGWLDDIAADAAEVTPEPAAATTETPELEEIPEAEPGDVPSWLEESSPGATATIVTWLGDRPGAEAAAETEEAEPTEAPPEGDLPSWMSDEESDAQPTSEEGVDETPSWLDGVAQAAAEPEIAPQIITPSEMEEEVSEEAEPMAEAEAPDWLQAIAGGEQPDAVEEVAEDSADWISNLRSSEEDEGTAPEELIVEDEEVPSPEEGAEWLSRIEPAEPAPQEDETPVEEDWLSRLTQPEEETPAEASPSWLSSEEESAPSGLGTQEPDWLDGIGEPEPEPETREQAESLDWLEGIGADDAAAAPEPEMDLDWLADTTVEEEADSAPSTPEPVAEEAEETGVPDWLQRDESPSLPPQPIPQEEMDWLQELGEPGEEPAAEIPTMEPPSEPAPTEETIDLTDADDGDVMEWLETLADQQEEPEAAPPESPEAEIVTPEIAPAPEGPLPETAEEGLDWLEELADTRGLDESLEIHRPAGAADDTTAAGWLQDLAEPEDLAAGAPSPTTIEPVPEPPASTTVEPVQEPVAEEIEPEPTVAEPEATVDVDITSAEPVLEPEPEIAAVELEAAKDMEVADQESVVEAEPETAVAPETSTTPEPIESEAAAPPTPTPTAVEPEPVSVEEIQPASPAPEPAADQEAPKEDPLSAAETLLATGDTNSAVKLYGKLIKRGKNLGEVITVLQEALKANERQPELWQTLGDAYMKDGQVDQAVQAYQRGMEVA